MKAVILDALGHKVSVADRDVMLCCVEHVGHTGPLQVTQVTNRLSVTNDDPSTNLKVYNWFMTVTVATVTV